MCEEIPFPLISLRSSHPLYFQERVGRTQLRLGFSKREAEGREVVGCFENKADETRMADLLDDLEKH